MNRRWNPGLCNHNVLKTDSSPSNAGIWSERLSPKHIYVTSLKQRTNLKGITLLIGHRRISFIFFFGVLQMPWSSPFIGSGKGTWLILKSIRFWILSSQLQKSSCRVCNSCMKKTWSIPLVFVRRRNIPKKIKIKNVFLAWTTCKSHRHAGTEPGFFCNGAEMNVKSTLNKKN